jgi:leucyl-tRNA synthetase
VDSQWLNQETHTLAVQVNGKNRGTIDVPHNASQEHIMSEIEQDPRLSSYLKGTVVRIIIVPGRMVSLVVRSM